MDLNNDASNPQLDFSWISMQTNPVTILKNLFAGVTRDEFISEPIPERIYSHTINTQLKPLLLEQ